MLLALTAWGDRWATPEGGPPIRFSHRPSGQVFIPAVHCSACGEPVVADDVDPMPGPGGRKAPGPMLVGDLMSTGE